MAETANTSGSATSAAQGAGGETKFDAAAFKKELLGEFKGLVASVVGEVIKPHVDQLAALGTTVADLAKPKEEKKAADAPKALTIEDVQKAIGDSQKAQQQSAETLAKKQALRAKVLAANGLDKLKPSLVNLPDIDDEAALDKAAKSLVADLNSSGVKLADVGGAQQNGGTAAASAAGSAAVAAAGKGFLQMPGTTGGAAAA